MRVLITGGAGFIGSNFIRHLLHVKKDVEVLNVDLLTYAGNLANLADVEKTFTGRYSFIKGDIADRKLIFHLFETSEIDWVVHFAAESHVDRSILGPQTFVRTNILGTFNLIEACRRFWPLEDMSCVGKKRFLHVSTDEVYGSVAESMYSTETSPYDPSSPYSASKASSDHMVKAFHRTYGLPAIVTHSSNNYGPFQFPEKLIPLIIFNAAKGRDLPVYGDGKNIRDWIYVEDHCKALMAVLRKGNLGESYNIGGQCEIQNIDVVHLICDYLDERLVLLGGRPRRNLVRFVTDRPGHDRRYALDTSKINEELGWRPGVGFEEGLARTIDWYLKNIKWVKNILNGTYMEYYRRQYGKRLHESKL
ncbi:MAG: dTDP-glucose 4,6-dehydratase [Deltaproteobacteria bacterium]|nr:dTDP-glucose 4,6-dehydratase [Deltaproteobacteria bacterium]